jgi:hypothetical protein
VGILASRLEKASKSKAPPCRKKRDKDGAPSLLSRRLLSEAVGLCDRSDSDAVVDVYSPRVEGFAV